MNKDWAEFVLRIIRTFNVLIKDKSLLDKEYFGNTFYAHLKDFVDAWDISEKQYDSTGRIIKWTMWIDSMRREMHLMHNTNVGLACNDMLHYVLHTTIVFINKYNFNNGYDGVFDFSYQFINGETIKFVWLDESKLNITSELLPGYFPTEIDKKFIKNYQVNNKKEWLKIIEQGMSLDLLHWRKI